MSIEKIYLPVQRLTSGPENHYFGYHDKSPWSNEGRYVLALETPLFNTSPTPSDILKIGIVDLKKEFSFRPIARTCAWNWQQGCMLRWLPNSNKNLLIHNDVENNHFISVIRNIDGEEVHKLPMPVYSVSHDGKKAMTLNFSRLARLRPGYGYIGVADSWKNEIAPHGDGIYFLDLKSDESELVISLDEMSEYAPRPGMKKSENWFNHLLFSPDDGRFVFLHRWRNPDKVLITRFFTASPGGDDIYLLLDDDMTSHFDWRDPKHILAWARKKDIGDRYFIFEDYSNKFDIVGDGVLARNGHCSYSPNRQWFVTDTYPKKNQKRDLLLCNPENERYIIIGEFYSPPELKDEVRCDLHPRWSNDGKYICIDSAHEGSRQMYVLDVKEIAKS